MKNGRKDGYGKLFNIDYSIMFKGNFKNDFIHQNDAIVYSGYDVKQFEGSLVEGMKQGIGKEYNENGQLVYHGGFLNDDYHGKDGRLYHETTGLLIYEGDFVKNTKEGFGTLYSRKGKFVYKGGFKNDSIHGDNVKIYHENGKLKFEGNMVEGKKEFHGKSYNVYGRLDHEGCYSCNRMHGKGIAFQSVGGWKDAVSEDYWLLYQGEYVNGVKKGFGRDYHPNGKLMYQGRFGGLADNTIPIYIYNENGSVKYFGLPQNQQHLYL